MFYAFIQNNSRGEYTGPAEVVIIEADTAEEANAQAVYAGLYFGEYRSGDCECCGMRWREAEESWPIPGKPDGYERFLDLSKAKAAHARGSVHVLLKGEEV